MDNAATNIEKLVKATGISADDLMKVSERLGKALKNAPILDIKEIAKMRLRLLKTKHGWFRFFLSEYWRWLFMALNL